MSRFRRTLSAVLPFLLACPMAYAVVLWSAATGDINFPGLTPTTINGMSIGQTTPAAGSFTTLSATSPISGAAGSFTTVTTSGLASLASAKIDTGTKTASATSGAATLDKNAGVITSEALTTAGLADYTLTLTNATIAAADQVLVNVGQGTNTQGDIVVGAVTAAAGSVVIVIRNAHATQALNGTIKIAFAVLKN